MTAALIRLALIIAAFTATNYKRVTPAQVHMFPPPPPTIILPPCMHTNSPRLCPRRHGWRLFERAEDELQLNMSTSINSSCPQY